MIGTIRRWCSHSPWRRAGVLVVALATIGGGAVAFRGLFLHRADAQQPPAKPAEAAAPATPSDYTSRVVAYVHGNQPVTRQELGEYLIARYGSDKVGLLVNSRIVEQACKERRCEVTAAEVEAELQNDIKQVGDKDGFMKVLATRYKKNLYEWKEDMIRPRLEMIKLANARITVSADDLKKAFEATYGEKVECRLILWPVAQKDKALELYGRLRDSETAFAEIAQKQDTSWLAAAGGKIKPIGRWTLDPKLEAEAFRLQPGQVSTLIHTREGITLVKCDKRIPADTTASFDKVKDALEKGIREQKLQKEMADAFKALKEERKPQIVLTKNDAAVPQNGTLPPPTQVVAYIHGMKSVTREDLGEFLIARYGAEKLEFLVNRKVIDQECAARNVVVTDTEVEKLFDDYLKLLQVDKKRFEEEFLSKWGKNAFEWREDVLRAELMLRQLATGRAKVTDEDIKKGFDAYFGERLECRVILWPPEGKKFAEREYVKLRDSEEAFAHAAKTQFSTNLAPHGGKLPIIGRNTLGDTNLEREAFALKPGEITPLIETPQGWVILKCDKRIPPDATAKLDEYRDKLTKEILEKKTQAEMRTHFAELKTKAKPQMILKTTGRGEDILEESRRLMSDLPPAAGAGQPR